MTTEDPYVRTERAVAASQKRGESEYLLAQVFMLRKDDDVTVLREGLKALRSVLRRLRYDDQGGYPAYTRKKRDGKHWGFSSTGLPQTTPEELDLLFALAGIEPDEIGEGDPKGVGACGTCGNARVHADGSRSERGYSGPCLHCGRPLMSHWVPVGKLLKRKDGKSWLDDR